jgi:predicted Zn-dependent protease
MKLSHILLFSGLLFFSTLFSQVSKTNYTPLRSTGEVPLELKKLSTEKYEIRKETFKKDDRRTRKTKEELVLQSTFAIDELLLSGDVLFNDTIGKYVNKVADELLKDDLELRKKLNFYIVKSSYVNAFTTERGAIFISLGLISKLNNEAELAFILSHEIIHYQENHILNGYLETSKIKKEKGKYKGQSIKEKLLSRSNYSKELELEADNKGFYLFTQSKYDPTAAISAMEVLKYSSYPIEDKVFDHSFLNHSNYTFPERYRLDTVRTIESEEDYDDSESTHPNIKKRKEKLLALLTDSSSKSKFIISEKAFQYVREISRFEVLNNYTSERDYGMAFYHNYLLQQEFPDNIFLKSNMGYVLYALATYKSNKNQLQVLRKYAKEQGEFQQVLYLFNRMSDEELAAIAVEYLYQLNKSIPTDLFIEKLMLEAFRTLIHREEMTLDFYVKKSEIEAILLKNTEEMLADPYANLDTTNYTDRQKAKLEREVKRQLKKREEKIQFDQFVFADILTEPRFDSIFKKITAEKENTVEDRNFVAQLRAKNKKKRKEEKFGVSLSADKIVLADPHYSKIDERKEIQTKYIKSEKKQLDFRESVYKNAERLDLEVSILGKKNSMKEDINRLNEISISNTWLEERLDHDFIKIIPYNYQFMKPLSESYGSDYFVWMGLFNARLKTEFNSTNFIVSLLSIYGFPIYLVQLAIPDYATYYYSIVVNVETNEVLNEEGTYTGTRDNNDLIQSQIYDTFFQIKRKKDYTK